MQIRSLPDHALFVLYNYTKSQLLSGSSHHQNVNRSPRRYQVNGHNKKWISQVEARKAMKGLRNNTSPDTGGFSKEFCNLLGDDLLEVFNTAYLRNQLSDTQRMAIVTLLHKTGEKDDITSWRPFSLLNVDVKSLTKCLANRLKKMHGHFVHEDQT